MKNLKELTLEELLESLRINNMFYDYLIGKKEIINKTDLDDILERLPVTQESNIAGVTLPKLAQTSHPKYPTKPPPLPPRRITEEEEEIDKEISQTVEKTVKGKEKPYFSYEHVEPLTYAELHATPPNIIPLTALEKLDAKLKTIYGMKLNKELIKNLKEERATIPNLKRGQKSRKIKQISLNADEVIKNPDAFTQKLTKL